MSIHTIAAAAVMPLLALTPAIALADLHVNSTGAYRVVASSTSGPQCHVHRSTDDPMSTTVRCATSARGTMTIYRHTSDGVACELDFWPQSTGGHNWRVIVTHQNPDAGTCNIQWQGPDTINLTVQ